MDRQPKDTNVAWVAYVGLVRRSLLPYTQFEGWMFLSGSTFHCRARIYITNYNQVG